VVLTGKPSYSRGRICPYDAPPTLFEPEDSTLRYPLRNRAVKTITAALYAQTLRSEHAASANPSSSDLGAEPAAPEGSGAGAQEMPALDACRLNWPQTGIFGAELAALKNPREKPVGHSLTYRSIAEPAAVDPTTDGLELVGVGGVPEHSLPTDGRIMEPTAGFDGLESPQVMEKEALTYWSEFSLSSTFPAYLAEERELGECVDDEPANAHTNAFNFREGVAALWSHDGAKLICGFLEEISRMRPPPSNASAKPNKRGGVRARAVKELAKGNGFVAKHLSLAKRAYHLGALHISGKFSTSTDASFASTGWHGRPPSIKCRKEITSLWKSGEIMQVLAEEFYPIPYNMDTPKPALLIDRELRTFGYRTTQFNFIRDNIDSLHSAIEALLRPHLDNPKLAAQHRNGSRGSHFPCIIGHHQQYTTSPTLTQFHIQNADAVQYFCNTPIFKRLSRLVSELVVTIFPGVALRAVKSAVWHEARNGIKPLFGLYWNFCINGMFHGQKRIFTSPHADAKNIVGICAVVVYAIPGKSFNHRKKAWLVLWEAGLVVELPPWVVFLYPSSLLYHFNVDVEDIEFVLTDGEKPTPQNSTPLGGEGDEGRGSLVFFNQASMYKGAETGFDTLMAARSAGMSGSTSSAEQIKLAFSQQVHTIDINMEEMDEVASMLTAFEVLDNPDFS
ncbi:hypothetical protein CVT26_013513, partial [Gymnopilus dilepis]